MLLALGTCWATFQAKNNVKRVPASSPASTEATACKPLIVTYAAVEKGMELKGEQR